MNDRVKPQIGDRIVVEIVGISGLDVIDGITVNYLRDGQKFAIPGFAWLKQRIADAIWSWSKKEAQGE